MIKIKIVCVGNLKEKYLLDAQTEFKKRLGKFCKLEIIECLESKIEDLHEKSIIKTLENEAINIKKHLSGYIVVLDVLGEQKSSIEFAKNINSICQNYSQITFVIGSSYGLSQNIMDMANFKLSFSKFTFPHQLMRIILLEQIYRAMCINNNVTYHK